MTACLLKTSWFYIHGFVLKTRSRRHGPIRFLTRSRAIHKYFLHPRDVYKPVWSLSYYHHTWLGSLPRELDKFTGLNNLSFTFFTTTWHRTCLLLFVGFCAHDTLVGAVLERQSVDLLLALALSGPSPGSPSGGYARGVGTVWPRRPRGPCLRIRGRLVDNRENLENNYCIFASVGTTRGQGIIRVVLLQPFSVILIFWKIFKVNEAQILTFWT